MNEEREDQIFFSIKLILFILHPSEPLVLIYKIPIPRWSMLFEDLVVK